MSTPVVEISDGLGFKARPFEGHPTLRTQPHVRSTFAGKVGDSGEGRWTLHFAIDEAVPVPVLAAALSSAILFRWSTLLIGLVLVILFIPIRRYTLPGSLPFDLEPYRVMVAVDSADFRTEMARQRER